MHGYLGNVGKHGVNTSEAVTTGSSKTKPPIHISGKTTFSPIEHLSLKNIIVLSMTVSQVPQRYVGNRVVLEPWKFIGEHIGLGMPVLPP